MKKIELLSPAGNIECLKAAILAGCDAVYLGGYMFGARTFATNFSNDEIIDAINYAHLYNVKVYVTVNTLVYENEVEQFIEYIRFLHKNNVDAVIVQDIGMMDLIVNTFPNLEVHASTQMHIHNLEGVKLAEKLGVKRAVLARETSIDNIKKIKNNSKIELEIFVHGALCVSYSGQCLMSSLIGGRSGNRGTCAGTCRQQYDVLDYNKTKVNQMNYNLSMKDLNSLENIGELIDAGVDSLKIEGRMKSPSYVYLVTKLYREAIDSYLKTGKVTINTEDLNNLKKTFNREFTKGFLFNARNDEVINPYRPNHLGVEVGKVISKNKNRITLKLSDSISLNDGIRFIGKEDSGMQITKMEVNNSKVNFANKGDIVTLFFSGKVEVGSIVVKTVDYLLNKDIENKLKENNFKIKIKGNFIARLNEPLSLTITDGIHSITRTSEIVEEAKNMAISNEKIEEQIKKTGNTIFEFEELNIDSDNNIFISIKTINELRRLALDDLNDLRNNKKIEYVETLYNRNVKKYNIERIKSIYVQSKEQYEYIKNMDYDIIYLDEEVYKKVDDDRKILKIPRVITDFKDYENKVMVGELGGIYKYNNIDTDFSLNVVNSYSIALLENLGVNRITISYELTKEQTKLMIDEYKKRYKTNPNLAVIVYAKEEMMISKFNLLDYYNIVDVGYLKDRFKNLYRITVKDNLMYINNYKARKLNIEEYYDLGISEIRYNIIEDEDLKYI